MTRLADLHGDTAIDDMSWLKPEWRTPPARCSLIRELQHGVEAHDDLPSVAERIDQLRAGRALQAVPTVASHGGSDTFQGLNLYALHRQTADVEWLGLVVLPHAQADALRAAIAASRKKKAA